MKVIISFVLFMLFLNLVLWWRSIPEKMVSVRVPHGSSAHKISEILYGLELISSKRVFVNAVRFLGRGKSLKAGAYLISSKTGLFGIIDILSSGEVQFVKVTIPEGFTSVQIAERLDAHSVVDKEKFLKIVKERDLEGYLFPETYYFETGSSEKHVIDSMVKEFNSIFTPEFNNRLKELSLSKRNAVILASIVEKEAIKPEERPLIAGVFYNRLKKRWYLESCATILYALGKHKKKLTYKDLEVDSPYNTYKHFGIPPGPISNPGLESIKAVLYPSQTDSMFFVVDGSGGHDFSRYYQEHLNKKKKR